MPINSEARSDSRVYDGEASLAHSSRHFPTKPNVRTKLSFCFDGPAFMTIGGAGLGSRVFGRDAPKEMEFVAPAEADKLPIVNDRSPCKSAIACLCSDFEVRQDHLYLERSYRFEVTFIPPKIET
jgi:hypothetical protein